MTARARPQRGPVRRPFRIALLALLLLLVITIALWRITKLPCWQMFGEVTCRVETGEKIVALSFDDGPTPEGVDAVIDELAKRRVHATFFLIGSKMARYPEQAKRLLAAGHELGNHSWSHKRMIGRSQAFYREEIARTDALLRAAGAAHPTLFRPPFGRRLAGLPLAVEQEGYRSITWDVADDAVHNITPETYARDIVSRARPGSIILIHPMYRGNRVERAAVPLVLDGLAAKGYRIVTVGELLKGEQPE